MADGDAIRRLLGEPIKGSDVFDVIEHPCKFPINHPAYSDPEHCWVCREFIRQGRNPF